MDMYTYQTFQQESLPPAVLVHTKDDSDPVAAYIAPRVPAQRKAADIVLTIVYVILAAFTIMSATNFFLMLGLILLLGFSYLTISDQINSAPTPPVDQQRTINALQKKYPSIRIINSEKDLFKEFPPYVNP